MPLVDPDPQIVIEDALHAWVVAGSGLAAHHVIWAAEATGGGPAPGGTYIEMRLIAVDRDSSDWLVSTRTSSGDVLLHVQGTRRPTLELTCIAGERYGSLRASQILDRVLTAVQQPTVAAILHAGGVGVGTRGKINVVPGVRSAMFDPRAVVEVGLHTMIDISEPGSAIESVTADMPGAVTSSVSKPSP